MLSTLSHVQLFVTPWTVAHQAPLSIGFSRPEYWSGLPCSPPGDLPNPGIKPRSPVLQADSLPPEPPGKPKDTGVGSLSLLWENFPTQESKQGLLHCRWILYQLSYQGNPKRRYNETQVRSLGLEDPLDRAWQSTPVFLPGESKDRA